MSLLGILTSVCRDLLIVIALITARLKMLNASIIAFLFFVVGYVEERLWWLIQSPSIGGKKKVSS